MGLAPETRDYFAEMYVAGVMADAGWNIYFPRRDIGFDFIATISAGATVIIRPVQVKGKYPTNTKGDKKIYGYIGKLSQTHEDMILAIPFFVSSEQAAPVTTAYIPFGQIAWNSNKPTQARCQPATYFDQQPAPRRDYAKFFDADGLVLAACESFCGERVG